MREPVASIFSGGTGRSGTTSVVNLISRHSQVHTSMPREIRYVTDPFGLLDLLSSSPRVFYSRSMMGKAADLKKFILRTDPADVFTEKMRTVWFESVGKKGKPRGLVQGLTLEQLDRELLTFQSQFKSDRLIASRRLFQRLAELQIENSGKSLEGLKYFADSTPINILHAHRIEKFLPGSRYINMVRDGRDVALSVVKERWGPSDPYEAITWWSGRMKAGFQALAQIPESSQLTLRLEDLVVNNREESYRKILSLLDLEDEAKLHRYFDENLLAQKMTQGSWKSAELNTSKFERLYDQELAKLADIGLVVEKFY